MSIVSAKNTLDGTIILVTLSNGAILHIQDDPSDHYRILLQEWLDAGNSIDPADPLPPPLTNAEIYDQVITSQKVLKAVVLALNDGTFTPGQNLTNAALKTVIKAKM